MVTKDLYKIDITEAVGFQIAKILKLKRRFIDTQMKPFGLSRTEWQVMFCLSHLGTCSQKDLLRTLDIDGGHLARTLEQLEEKKYIKRVPLKNDRRCLSIEVTEYCQKNLMSHIKSIHEKEEQTLLNGISVEDKPYLMQMLHKLENNLELELNKYLEN